jgi:hypothetical protein
MRIKCFFLEPTEKFSRSLRRYTYSDANKCPGSTYGHDASVKIEDGESCDKHRSGDHHPHDDPRWPTKCEKCDYVFAAEDTWQLFCSTLYVRKDTGELTTLRDAPPGAMWDAEWLHDIYPDRLGDDGKYLIVKTPGGDWAVDSRASNCTRPDDKEHRCWCRHGVAPDIHVDKDGNTCAAGAGSIICGSYHGFLRHGHLEEC